MRVSRLLVVTLLVVAAVALQVGLFPHLSLAGVVPDLVLLVVVAVALVRGPESGAATGLVAGLVLDAAPPADHTLGRWALALVVVGWLAGSVRQDARRSVPASAVLVGACAFVGTSIFALSGLVLGDPGVSVAAVLLVVPVAVAYDVAVGLVLLRPITHLLDRFEPRRRALPTLVGAR
ncbi:rod shape-determining protein MreD [Solicola sp. PLA-1-18]|uniref:rod shape-determining protein MreD n=1 Tax=Solicola sp. PLA-1-18 TaxID=3380532 RepID=UPI003B7C16E2